MTGMLSPLKKLSARGRRTRIATLVATACVAIGVTIPLLASGNDSVTLQTVSAAQLAAEGMSLHQPAISASVTQAGAIQAASAAFPPSPLVRESVLARIEDANVPLIDGRTLWIVSLMPTGGFMPPSAGPAPGAPVAPARFLLVFIDPTTGEFVFGDAGS
jgi:hypothetical protein